MILSRKQLEAGMVLSMAGLYFFSFFQRVAVPGSVFNELQSEFAMSAAEVTKLSAIYLFVYASMQPFAGLLADRFGGVKVVLASGALLLAGSVFFPLSHGVWTLYLSRVLVGLGASTMYLCLVKETDHYFGGKNFAPIFGLMCMIGYSGGLAGTSPFRALVEAYGWRTSCFAAGVGTFVMIAMAWATSRRIGDHEEGVAGEIWSGVMVVVRNRLNYPIVLTVASSFSIYFSLQAVIGPKFLADCCGISPLASSQCTFVMMLATMGSMLTSGMISKAMGNRRKVFIVFNGMASCLAALILLAGTLLKAPLSVFVCAFVLLALASGCTPVQAALVKESNAPGRVAVSIGLLNTCCYVMVAIMSQVIGLVLDLFGAKAVVTATAKVYPVSAYATLFVVLLAVGVIAAAASFFAKETHGKDISGCDDGGLL